MKHYIVFDTPVPKADGLKAEGGRFGISLIVDVHHCRDTVRKQFNVEGLNEWEKHLTR